jgi:Flp pilus assembly protein TadG
VTTLAVVLVIPALLLLIMTIAQFVVYYHASHLAIAAAEEGLRAAQAADATAADGQAGAQDFISQAGPGLVLRPVVDATRDADSARVEVRGRAPQFVPGIRIELHSVASGPVERFVGDTG